MKKERSILGLRWKSILSDRPKQNQWVLIAWQIGNYIGYNSVVWDTDDNYCQHAVAWCALGSKEVIPKSFAVDRANKAKLPLLDWSHHFSVMINNIYIGKDKLPKKAQGL